MTAYPLQSDLPEWIHVRDAVGRITWATETVREMFGWSDSTGVPHEDQEAGQFEQASRACIDHGHWVGVISRRDVHGNARSLESRWSVQRDASGSVSGFLIIEVDLSLRRQTDENLLRAQRMESISTLAGGVAHDINNVLGPILMGAEMIRRKVDDPWVQKKLEGMEASARRGADIVRQVLDFSRGAEGEKIVVQIRHTLKELKEFAGHTFSKSITIEGDFPRDLPPIVGDAAQLRQAILNLMVNARDAMPNGGTLSLRCAPATLSSEEAAALSPLGVAGHFARIDVVDTGTGIPEHQIDRIFEPFFTTKPRGQGTGLGLSTTLSIIRGHGGFMAVSSAAGQGTTMSVFLPAAVPESDPIPASSPTVDATTGGGGRTILIVDDEPMMLEMNVDLLQSFDYRTKTAENGQRGLDVFRENPDGIDLVITDINMPVMDGPTMIREMRVLRSDLPVLAVSGLSEVEHAKDGTGLEGIQILHKPYSTDELLNAIAERIGSALPGKGAAHTAPPGQAAVDQPTDREHSGDTLSDSAFDQLMDGDW